MRHIKNFACSLGGFESLWKFDVLDLKCPLYKTSQLFRKSTPTFCPNDAEQLKIIL